MPDRVSTIRFKVEGTQEVTSKISELNREAVRQQRDLARSLSQAMKEQEGGKVDPTDTIRRAKTDALRLANVRQMLVKEQANLEQRELASSRTQLANQARVRAADYRKQQSEFSDLARVRLSADEKADRTVLSRRQKVNETEHQLMASERERVKKVRLDDLNEFLGREDAKAKAYEKGQKERAKAEAKAKRESMGGALSGFGGKMVLGMAAGKLAGDVLGPGAAQLGSIASGFMFGGPVIGAAVGAMELLGLAVSHTREKQEELTKSTRDYFAELGKLSAREQDAAKILLPLTRAGRELENEREQIEADRAEKAEKHRQAIEDKQKLMAKTELALQFFFDPFWKRNFRISGEQEAIYAKEQKDLAERAKLREDSWEAERRAEDRSIQAERAAAIERARISTIPGARGGFLLDALDAAENNRKAEEAGREELHLLDVRQAAALDAAKRAGDDIVALEASQARDRVAIEQKTQADVAAARDEGAYKQKARSAEFIYSEHNRLSPVFQLKEYGIKLKDAVDHNATTIDEAKMLMQRKVMELYSSVLAPHDFKVGDSRSRLNLAAMNPMMAMVMAGAKIPAYADGTDNHPGGLALVGEKGPELIRLAKHSQVIPFGPQAPKINAHGGFINGVAASKYHKAPPEGGLINGVRADEMLRESGRWGNELGRGSAHLRDPRHRGKSQEADLYGARLSRWTAPTGTGREMGNSKEFKEWAKSHPLHSYHPKAEVLGPPIPTAVKKGVAGVPSQYHKLFEDAPAGYYQPHSMLARVRASHHAKAGGGTHALIDPLTGRGIDTGSFGGIDARGGGVGGAIGQSQQLAQIARQILQILQAHQGLQ